MAPGRKNKATRTRRYLRPASQAAKPRKKSQAEFSFHREVSRKLTYIERAFFLFSISSLFHAYIISLLEGVLVGLVNYIEEVSPPPNGQIIVDDLIDHSKFFISFVDDFHIIKYL